MELLNLDDSLHDVDYTPSPTSKISKVSDLGSKDWKEGYQSVFGSKMSKD